MRRVIRKRIRHQAEGVDLALDLNADVAINVGRTTVPPPARAEPAEDERPEPPSQDGADRDEPGDPHKQGRKP